ncbi:hypothetical protein BC936DRAFT_139475 [Jimgerdemannia flammicorona]|uniref:Barwin domain-containing protein n=1 Tax=Jimgerdemannia flammicorona TaxID=994334 RepID=A0A433DMS5_9FUNG|nr:hypothetical protein BC936DRAFT_139475 [Jimgerdemannia flammicorona]
MKARLVIFLIVLLACLFSFVDARPLKANAKKGKVKNNSKPKSGGCNPGGPFKKVIATPCGAFLNTTDKYACGVHVSSTDMAAAIATPQWVGIGAYSVSCVCFKKIKVTNIANGKSVVIAILDHKLVEDKGGLDLTTKAWNELYTPDDVHRGNLYANWDWV